MVVSETALEEIGDLPCKVIELFAVVVADSYQNVDKIQSWLVNKRNNNNNNNSNNNKNLRSES